jgi:hypothetical protein
MAKTEVGNKCGEGSFADNQHGELASIPEFDILRACDYNHARARPPQF